MTASSLVTQPLSLSSSYLGSVLPAVCAHYGLTTDMLLMRAGLPADLLTRPGDMVSFERVVVLFLNIMNMTRDEALGAVAGSCVQPRSYQVMGYAIMTSDTLEAAIGRLIRYETLVGKLGRTEMRREGDQVELVWHSPLSGVWACYLKEAAVAGWVTFARSLLSEVPDYEVCFDHPLRGDVAPYHAILGERVSFGAAFTGVRLPASALGIAVKSADPGLCAVLDREARTALTEFDSRINLSNEVRAVIAQCLPEGEPTLETVAHRLGLPVRSMQARLREGGQPFKTLVDEVRRQLAALYLQRDDVSLVDVGFLLGFSEQSAFSRAFRRWYGMAPQQYQKSPASP